MTNIFVGFHDNRSSSRILKPPGGGTSDIFGTDKVPDVVPKKVSENTETANKIETIPSEPNKVDQNGTSKDEDHNKTEQQNGNVSPDLEETKTAANKNEKQNEELKEELTIEEVKLDKLKIEEKSGVPELNVNKSDSVDSPFKKTPESPQPKSSSIGNILRQDVVQPEVCEKKKTPNRQNRVPPGGYSSGLW